MDRRILGGLLGAAASFSVLVAPSVATAAEVPCGAPAVPAVVETVTHPAGPATAPAQTHVEYLWSRVVTVEERQYALISADGYRAFEWSRESGVVIGPGGEQTSSKESILLPKGAVPSGDGWELTGASFWIDTTASKIWSLVAPSGLKWEYTGRSRVVSRETETTTEHSATPPDGEGWEAVPGSGIVVVDVPEQVVEHDEPWTEEIEVSPAVPAGEPCPTASPSVGPGGPATEAATPSTEPTVLGVDRELTATPAAVPTAVDAGTGGTGREDVAFGWLGALLVLGAGAGAVGVTAARRPAPRH